MNPLSVAKNLIKNPLGTKQPQDGEENAIDDENEEDEEDNENDNEHENEKEDGEQITTKVNLVDLLHDDNAHVAELFFQYSQAEEDDEKQSLFDQIKLGMKVHAQLVEEMYYPLLPESVEEAEKEDAQKLVFEAEAGNYVASMIIDVLSTMKPSDDYFDGKMSILCELAKSQTKKEEKEIFDKLKAAETEVDFEEVGINAAERKMELEEEVTASFSKRSKKSTKASSKKASATKGKAASKGKVAAKGRAAAKGKTGAKAAAKKATPKSKTSAKGKAAPKAKAKPGAKAKAGAKTKVGAKAKAGAKAKTGTKTKTGAKSKTAPKASAKSKSGSKAKAGAKSGAKTARATSKSAKKPAAKKPAKRSK